MSTTIDLGKLRFNWVGEWASNTQYESNDLVKYGGDVFVYIYALKTSGNITTNATYWALVQEGLSWKGEYVAATAYKSHEVVHHANNAYVCILSEPAAGNAPPNATYWQLLATGVKFEGAYDNATVYQVDDIVYYGANTYICILNSSGGNLPTNATYWNTFSHGIQWEGLYNNSSSYQKDDVVTYGASVYISKMDNVGQLPTDTAKWDTLTSGIKYTAAWNTATADYRIDDVATFGGNAYIATANNPTTGSDPSVNTTQWDVLSSGIDWMGNWAVGTAYQKDDVVAYGGNTYIARITNTGDNPETVTASWERMTAGIAWTGPWSAATNYTKDDLVSYGGSTYVAQAININKNPVTETASWQVLAAGIDFIGVWAVGTAYQKDDIVTYGATTYIALVNTTGDNPGSVPASWQVLAAGVQWLGPWVTGTAYVKGDIISYGGSTYVALLNTTGDNPVTVTASWQPFAMGLDFIGVWSTAVAYQKHDIVTYGGNSYVAKVTNTGDIPNLITASWERMTAGLRHIGAWATSTAYLMDDIVTYGGQTYKTLVSHSSGVFATDLAATKWVKFSGGMDWKGDWLTATAYKVNDIVNSGGAVYVATADHTSTSFGSDSASWDSFANAGTDVAITITTHGDLLYRDATGPARLGPGALGQILQTGGANADPKFLTQGTSGQLLTSAGAAADPTWAEPVALVPYKIVDTFIAPVTFSVDEVKKADVIANNTQVVGTWEIFGDSQLYVTDLTTITSNDEYLVTTASKSNHLWYDTLYIGDEAVITVSDTMQGIGTATVAAVAVASGGASASTDSTPHTVNTVVPEDNDLIIGAIYSYSSRQNVYSTGDWASSGANSTYNSNLGDASGLLQSWNYLLGDGKPQATSGTSGNLTYFNNTYPGVRIKEYAHNRRLGHNYKYWYFNDNASSYPGVTISCLPIRNSSGSSIDVVIDTYKSSNGNQAGAASGSGIAYYTPTFSSGTNYANATGGSWTTLNSTTTGSDEHQYEATVPVPGGTTVLLMMVAHWKYRTSYQFFSTNLYVDLHTAFASSSITCDLRMLEALATCRQPAAIYNAATPYEMYTSCATVYGDR